MAVPKRPCIDCGVLTDGKTRCQPCTRREQRARDAKRGTPAQRGYDATYQKHRRLILSHHPPCVYCGRRADTVDHVIALASGGTNELSNLVAACGECNASRGAKLGNARRAARGDC